jgi:hypothetical protein
VIRDIFQALNGVFQNYDHQPLFANFREPPAP